MPGRVGHYVVCFREIHRAAVEGADFRQALSDMFDALFRAGHVGASLIKRQWRVGRSQDEVAAHTGRQIDDNVGVRLSRMRSVTSRYRSTRRENAPVSGSRTWQCTIAAPAFAASIALAAISFGVRGTCGDLSCVLPEPVTGQVMKTSLFICRGILLPPLWFKSIARGRSSLFQSPGPTSQTPL